MHTKHIITICILLAILVGGFYTLNSYIYTEKQGNGQVATTTDTTPGESEPLTPILPSASTSTTPGKESATGPCYVGGCSGEVCSGERDVASNCIYREEFMCYKKTNARCERQTETGKCGWTQTVALKTCISASVSIN